MAAVGVFEEDRSNFRQFFHRERLLGQFFAGNREGVLEYRTVLEGALQWYRAELQMVSDPTTGDVKASFLISNVDVRRKEKEKLRHEAERDTMTGLYNHATVEMLIRQEMELDTGVRCCFLIIDLDDLRMINSKLGHPEGDRALKAISDCMRAQFRKTDIMGRIGGDEFVVLLKDVPEMERLQNAIKKFVKRLNAVNIGPLNDRPVHASIGAAMGTAGIDDFETMYRQADLALFYTKANGKNHFTFYTPELEQREFTYQPNVVEALAGMEAIGSVEFQKLFDAVATCFPMVISVNLTKNTYYMMRYVPYTLQKHDEQGIFEELVEDGASTFHPADRESFLRAFRRDRLLEAFGRGERVVRHTGRQLGSDGVYRSSQTTVVLMKDERSGDICEITFSHVFTEDMT